MRSDGIKVLYDPGEQKPDLIVPYAEEFPRRLSDRQNRLIWRNGCALATIADVAADEIYP